MGDCLIGPALGFGLAFGLKHAVEADHVAAVTAIVSQRRSVWSSSLVGGLWGVGHTLSLLLAGVMVLVLRLEIGPRTAQLLEVAVGLMLVILGVHALAKLRRGAPRAHGELRLGWRPFLMGMVHGLAGSSALMLIVLSTVPTVLLGMVYLGLFGLGSIGGMMLMSALVSLPFHFTRARFERVNLAICVFAGVFSVGFGAFMLYEVGFVDTPAADGAVGR